MDQTELDSGVLKIVLDGSLDIAGAADVDMQFMIVAGSKDKVIVDLTAVDFLASIGVRTLVKTAKPIVARGGKMVLVNPNEAVQKVLVSTGMDSLVPIEPDEASALTHFG